MQSSTTSSDPGYTSTNINAFRFEHNDNTSKCVKKFPKYSHTLIDNHSSLDSNNDDNESVALSALTTIEENIDEYDNNDDNDNHDNHERQHSKDGNYKQMDKGSFQQSFSYIDCLSDSQEETNVPTTQEKVANGNIELTSTITEVHNEKNSNGKQNIGAFCNTAEVPRIVVSYDETDTTSSSKRPVHHQSKAAKATASFPSVKPTNMDNMNLKTQTNTSTYPDSTTLSEKTSSSRINSINLSPFGVPSTPTSHVPGGTKRRGMNHRSSYKRAHTGRFSIDHTPNELFIELQQLRLDGGNDFYWEECARWIRYEEDFDVDMQRWQAPRIGCLNFHSLLELRRGLQYGIVLLDLDEQTIEGIYDGIINDAIAMGLLSKDLKDELLRILTSDHRHPETRSTLRRRSSIFDFPQVAIRRSSLAFRKGELINPDETRRRSLLPLEPNGELNKIVRNLVVKYDDIDEIVSTDAHPKRAMSEQNNCNTGDRRESTNQLRPINVIRRLSQVQTKKTRDSIPYKSDVLRRIPNDAECAEVLVGHLSSLVRPIMAFVRLSQGQVMDTMSEIPLPVRFIFLLIGPGTEEYFEIGRSLSTLFSTPAFRNRAYQAMYRRDLLSGISDFFTDSIVLPPGDFDKELLLPIIETAKIKKHNASKRAAWLKNQEKNGVIDILSPFNQQSQQQNCPSGILLTNLSSLPSHDKQDEDPFLRSGFLFGGAFHEMRRRYACFKSDFVDACSVHCFISLVFMFIACLAPALTFGGIIADKTNNRLGVGEMLIASSINGFLFGSISGQPLLILGPTGPFMVFEEVVYDLCQSLNADFWTVRCCVSLWTSFFIIILVAFEGSFMIRHVTRFTEEIFALIIALVYLYEPFKKLYKIFLSNPVLSKYSYQYPLHCSCNQSSISSTVHILSSVNSTLKDFVSSPVSKYSCYDCTSDQDSLTPSTQLYNNSISMNDDENQLPNKALLSLIILIGTCFISVALKRFRRSYFFGRTTRQTLSDFGMTIALICMVLFDVLLTKSTGGHNLTQKISVPDSIRPSDVERGNTWFISPLRRQLQFWMYFASSFPAILISVVLFFEVELTSIMIQSKLKCVHPTKNIKGTGYHLDVLIAGVLISMSGLFGLPWICAAPVRSLAHVASLSQYSNTHAPGEKARLIDIKDQRLTNIGVHLLIGCTIFAAPIIRKIPVAALFGIFLYFGIVSISGTQLFSRIKMTFIPTKYHPNFGYLRRVRELKRNIYTLIQVIAAVLLITIKMTHFAFLFPFILVLLVPFRKHCLPLIFTDRELTELDGDEEPSGTFDDEIDFYGQVHLPI